MSFEKHALWGFAPLCLILPIIAQIKGITVLASKTSMNRQDIQKALSSKENPQLDNINSSIHDLGYRLIPQKIEL